MSVNMNAGLTPAQGRVQFHMERLFKSTGGAGSRAHRVFVTLCDVAGLPAAVATYTREQCIAACKLIEDACRRTGLHQFRDVRTDWHQL